MDMDSAVIRLRRQDQPLTPPPHQASVATTTAGEVCALSACGWLRAVVAAAATLLLPPPPSLPHLFMWRGEGGVPQIVVLMGPDPHTPWDLQPNTDGPEPAPTGGARRAPPPRRAQQLDSSTGTCLFMESMCFSHTIRNQALP
jgi:hypothetical protein